MSQPIQVTSNVYQLGGAVNIYLLKTGDNELTVIDAGIPGATKRILQAAERIGYGPESIRHVLITHADFDHIGSLSGLVKATGATVYASALSSSFMERAQPPSHSQPIMTAVLGLLEPLLVKGVPVDEVVGDGDTLPIGGGIDVLATPGHTEGSLSYFWRSENVLFAADLLMTQGGKLRPMPGFITWSKEAVRNSTRKALALEPAFIAVGHGPVADAMASSVEIAELKAP
ncbi:MBL fold metallo-hydrolase [Phototrophicus methaneseepsis]|uniref:MBL fold metallo-hydrolase n=1 Tax=Phototrophicus methaneseepsis TaxID=2710758 RepID=A0A7S8E988_9CHLR|nr:MBL fold metallo-hydrolase [Phototrophicus methaneseepsis]QPC82579.1 MBL fold metallo-hydrolase [Phototrophicus methaneseepsis]